MSVVIIIFQDEIDCQNGGKCNVTVSWQASGYCWEYVKSQCQNYPCNLENCTKSLVQMPGYCRTEECYVPPAPIPPGKQNIYFIVFICVSVCAMSVVEMFKEIIFHYRACSSWIELDHSCDNDMCYCLFNCHSILEQKKKNRKDCPRWSFRPFFEVPIMCFGAIKVFQRQPW